MLLHKRTVNNTGMAAFGSAGETMKIFTAIVTQAGAGNPPSVTVLVNTLGQNIHTVSYDASGVYTITFDAAVFGANEAISFTNGTDIGYGVVYANITGADSLRLASTNGFSSYEDDIIVNASLIILIP